MISEATRLHRTRPLALAPAVAVGALCLALATIVDALIRHESHPTGDEPHYQVMASRPTAPHNFPYAYRIGVPWLVQALPFSQTTSFTLLALLAIGAAGGAMFALLEEFGVERWLAMALSVGFALSPTLLVVLPRHGRSIDPASILVLVLGCLFIVRRQRDALARQYEPGYSGPFFKARVDLVRQALSGSSVPIELRRVALAFGVLWLLAPFALRDLPFARRGLVLVVLCLAAMTYAFDWGRIIFLAAPVIYVAAAYVPRGRVRLAPAAVVAVLALDVGYGIYLQVHGVQHGLDTTVSRHVPVY